jgi:hypothetical protein
MALQPFVGPWAFFFSFLIFCTVGRPIAGKLPTIEIDQFPPKSVYGGGGSLHLLMEADPVP